MKKLIAFAMIPFAYAKRTVNYYDNHIKETSVMTDSSALA